MIKNICFCLLWLIIALSSFSFAHDLEQGTVEIGGAMDISVSSMKRDTDGSDSLDEDNISMSVAGFYYAVKNLGIGLALSYDSTNSSTSGEDYESKMLIIGPALSCNISLDTKLSVKIQGTIGAIKGDGESEGYSVSSDGQSWRIGGSFSYFFNDNVSLDFFLSLLSYNVDRDINNYGTKYTYEEKIKGFRSGLGLTTYF